MKARRRTLPIALALGLAALLALALPAGLLAMQVVTKAQGAPLGWQRQNGDSSPTFAVPPGWKVSPDCYGWTSPHKLTVCEPATLGGRICVRPTQYTWDAAATLIHVGGSTNPNGFVDARDAATSVATIAAADMFRNLAGAAARLQEGTPRDVPLGSVTAVHQVVHASAAAGDACTPGAGVVRTLALPSVEDGFEVLIVEATRDAVSDRDLDQIVSSVRY